MGAACNFPPDVSELRRARCLADNTSAQPPLLDSIRLVIAELASNAIAHAQTPFTVTVSEDPGGTVTVAVHDDSPLLPQRRDPSPESLRGRGLMLVDHLATEWGTTSNPDDGKTVWAVLTAE
jgi:two-component sensor histidine kinase